MLDNKNLFYLWYMEAKKNNNISINYNMGVNLNKNICNIILKLIFCRIKTLFLINVFNDFEV